MAETHKKKNGRRNIKNTYQKLTITLDVTSNQKQHIIKLPRIWRVLLQCNSASGKISEKFPGSIETNSQSA